ncbi:hypothetical protein AK830_g11779 [Neonectria ditissima]|uniref:Uncharacterized protein n=1 Tax=Neonectria ditissima TaxID=78410 RepID=A0A0P7B4J4_9HYPO|nr:hypothetical protein AK830_g11779 [Neonectria ditissima]
MSALNASGLQAIEPQQLGFTLLSLLAVALAYVSLRRHRHGDIPCLNRPAKLDLFGQKTKQHFVFNARNLMAEGHRLFQGKPYRLFTDLGDLMVIPSHLVDHVRNEPDLSFMDFFIDNFHPDIPGFDGFKFDGRKDELLHRTINKRLTKLLNKVISPLSLKATFATNHVLGISSDWQEAPIMDTMLELVARLSSRVFLGEILCRNEDWLAITKSYTVNTTAAGDLLRQYPKWLRPFVLDPLLQKRKEERDLALATGKPEPTYNDTIQWLVEESRGSPYDPVAAQLGFSVVAIHTTSDLTTETMLRLAERPELINDIIQEIEEVLKVEGWTKTALYSMKLLDSVIKEAQRLKPLTSAPMNRKATTRVTLPGGLVLEKGDRCMSDLGSMMDPNIYPNPDEFDGYRFFRMRGDPKTDGKAHLVSTSSAHMGFGHGKHACPGRFFAANEVKLLLCHLLYKYEWKLAEGYIHKVTEFGLALIQNGEAKISFRRRQNLSFNIDSLELAP